MLLHGTTLLGVRIGAPTPWSDAGFKSLLPAARLRQDEEEE